MRWILIVLAALALFTFGCDDGCNCSNATGAECQDALIDCNDENGDYFECQMEHGNEYCEKLWCDCMDSYGCIEFAIYSGFEC